ncbi:guanine nucleotide exchange factor for Rab-3A-like [Rhopilema esculentum]|uniref:guanine nucleotide exchange factor for Rab-3A-like n=1 Tax=Rhopilema esculentum TaxID=499914 RepID=UPI0031CFFACE
MQEDSQNTLTLTVAAARDPMKDDDPRGRTKSYEPTIVRTSSDPDLNSRGRSKSSVSQCSRSRSQTKTQLSIDELMMEPSSEARRKNSFYGYPRPNPVGMAASTSIDLETEEGDLSQSYNFSKDSDSTNAKTATEVLEERRRRQKQKEAAFLKLRQELARAHQELRKRDEECKKLSSVRDDLDKEVEDLTASLFEEAHKMVTDAKTKQASAEMQLKEAQMKMDGLEAEVAALKLLVITSTPSNPGKKGHRRSPSADQICSDCQTYHSVVDGTRSEDSWDVIEIENEKEVDRLAHREFVSWLEKHCPLNEHPFLETIERLDVIPCLQFQNQELSFDILKAIKDNSLIIEPIPGSQRTRRCSLSKSSVLCPYRVRIGENGKWHFISSGCRSRLIAVADLYTFCRYIKNGLIRKEVNAMYWDLMRKRGQISLTRLGLVKS